jgi:metal-responsive CopG/Arc/MetJ family transcriptional regulator
MKTAISISDAVFREAEQTAQQLGLTRSKLYSMAVLEFIQNHNPQAVTAKLNSVYSKTESKLDDDIIQATHDLLAQDEW